MCVMNNNETTLQEVSFAFTSDSLLKQLRAESSYIAHSLYTAMPEKNSVAQLILSEDVAEFVSMELKNAFANIYSALSAYLCDSSQCVADPFTVVLRMPGGRNYGIDALLLHELQRAIVTFVLARWYEYRLPDVAAQQMQLHQAAISAVRHDVFMAYGAAKRPCNYF